MALHLVARDVARLNIEKIDLLGAFNGAHKCRYHYGKGYPRGCGCAIGIADPEKILADRGPGYDDRIRSLHNEGRIVCSDEDLPVLSFIQDLHDFIINFPNDLTGSTVRRFFSERNSYAAVPDCVRDIFDEMVTLNKATYGQIMESIAEVA